MEQTLELQLSELEMLQSMYPEEGIVTLDKPDLLEDVRSYLDCKQDYLPAQISFTIKLNITEQDECYDDPISFELFCDFPHNYPMNNPELFIRCDLLNREEQKNLNCKLREYIEDLTSGELCVGPALQWIQENLLRFIQHDDSDSLTRKSSASHSDKAITDTSIKQKNCNVVSRLWLYMHHIYSKTKRKVIVEWAQELALTGFCLPGKPGIVCVEGEEESVSDYFSRLRRLNWKRITSRHRENSPTLQRKFSTFEEVAFDVHGGHNYHMDLGQFSQYLQDHDLGEMFHMIFGVKGK